MSKRDPDLSDKWLGEAEWRALHDQSRKFERTDSRKIILRLVEELRRVNKEYDR